MPREISSLQHPIVKYLTKLRKSRDFRRAQNRVLVAGKKIIVELARDFPLKTLIVERGAPPLEVSSDEIFAVTPAILKKITALEQPEPYAAEIALPARGTLSGKKFLLALDGVSDPGNLGTLIRSALALGWEGVFLTLGSADPFSEKALRAAKGATFYLPIVEGSNEDLAKLIAKEKLSVLLADMDGKNVEDEKITPPIILVLGGEAQGIKFAARDATTVSIPLAEKSESLNVAIAGGILMYLLRRHYE
ncbi:MAG: TrmH family RNA methyltransferase [Chlamydiales bacterium]